VSSRDPVEPIAVAALVFAVALAIGCLFALLGIALGERGGASARGRRGRQRRVQALRRGAVIGVIVAAVGLLRAIDGLTIVTGGFVVAGLLLAELVLEARPASASH
jgi:hypothetical protein